MWMRSQKAATWRTEKDRVQGTKKIGRDKGCILLGRIHSKENMPNVAVTSDHLAAMSLSQQRLDKRFCGMGLVREMVQS